MKTSHHSAPPPAVLLQVLGEQTLLVLRLQLLLELSVAYGRCAVCCCSLLLVRVAAAWFAVLKCRCCVAVTKQTPTSSTERTAACKSEE